MIITRLRLQEEHPMTGPSASWPLPICDLNLDLTSGENGYILKDAEGLAPPELSASVIGFDNNGVPILESFVDKREIVLKLGLSPRFGQSYSSLREALYKYISRTIYVQLMNSSTVVAQTRGFIRNIEPVLFSNVPTLDVTIECADGDFVSPFSVAIPLASIDIAQPVFNYEDGNAPTGLELQFTVDSSHAGFSITDHAKFWHAGSGDIDTEFTVDFAFVAGDTVTISTTPGAKKVTLLRSSVLYDLAGYINAGAVWPKLFSGVNAFGWDIHGSWMTWVSASYTPRYWGV